MTFEPGAFGIFIVALAVLLTMTALWIATSRYEKVLLALHLQWFDVVGVCLFAAGVSWFALRMGIALLNLTLRRMPRFRRVLRGWLKRRGISLLPPRRRVLAATESMLPMIGPLKERDPILGMNEGYKRIWWNRSKPWIKRGMGVVITGWIFYAILKPVIKNWHDPAVQQRLADIEPWRFIVAVLMFAVFLFVFRAMAWRWIIKSFGFRLPVAAAVRIWSTSELARYVPGAIFQVVGRVVLAKPYGIRGSVTSVSQVLELAVFLLANVLLAISCLLYFGIKNLHGPARTWLLVAAGIAPVLLFLLHPKICYGIINRVMARLGKPILEQRVSGMGLVGILVWNVIGLVWQSAAVYVLTAHALGLKADWWWVLAGAYSLAWCAGFIAFWAPGGVGVRELVFVTAMSVAIPRAVRDQLGPSTLKIFLLFLSLLLRLWATAGELVLAGIAYALDYRGALGRPDAPGRVAVTDDTAEKTLNSVAGV
jgi:hypothetical protein